MGGAKGFYIVGELALQKCLHIVATGAKARKQGQGRVAPWGEVGLKRLGHGSLI